MSTRPFSVYADRNAAPILQVLEFEFRDVQSVFEIGSGSGQHAAKFAAALPHLEWQPSDRQENIPGIEAWVNGAKLSNLLAPLVYDVLDEPSYYDQCDAIYSANTAHIMGISAVRAMYSQVGGLLGQGGRFCLYGPFGFDGKFTAPSNAAFDEKLRLEDAEMGIRDIEFLDQIAKDAGLQRQRLYAMPANNHLAVWQKVE